MWRAANLRRAVVLGVLVLVTGCQNTVGPLMSRQRTGRPDDPFFPIEEQRRRVRDRSSLPLDDAKVTPDAYIGPYGPTGGK